MRFGRLTVIRRLENEGRLRSWLTKCDCGATKVATGHVLRSGHTKSCGCLRREVTRAKALAANHKHGFCAGRVPRWYSIWSGMMKRCYNPRTAAYVRYGGRGIVVSERWHDPAAFLADMGEPPAGMSIDRIDSDGHYVPENCRWATDKIQGSNRRGVRWIEYNGIRDNMSGWARRVGISPANMLARLRDWPIERALTEPPRKR